MMIWAFILIASAAPAPATSSSAVLDVDHGLFRSPLGFSLNKGGTSWIPTSPPREVSQVVAIYRAPLNPQGVQPALTVRTDRLSQPLSLQNYAHQWMKDYSRLGFDVLTAKQIRIVNQPAFLIDTLHRESDRQLRQVVFLRERTAVVLTCRDHRKSFLQSVKACNEIIRTFRWSI